LTFTPFVPLETAMHIPQYTILFYRVTSSNSKDKILIIDLWKCERFLLENW